MRLIGLVPALRSHTLEWHVDEDDLAGDTKKKARKKSGVPQTWKGISKKRGEPMV